MSNSIRTHRRDHSIQSTSSYRSDGSRDSSSTAPTSVYRSPAPSHYGSYTKQHHDISPATKHFPRSSTETYSSTVDSFHQEYTGEPESYDEYYVDENRPVSDTNVRPSNPSDFAEYFPTMKRLHICHDDTTPDGNLNLRVDIDGRKKEKIQLFHLRMQDIQKRDFSLRRYERSSGREVCKSSRKYQEPPVAKRPATLSRSVSNAFATFTKPDYKRASSALSTFSAGNNKSMPFRRKDSGYGSDGEDDDFENYMKKDTASKVPTNTTKLEFSNYAQVEVRRKGAKASKRYEFEYWGYDYAWRRVVNKDGPGKEISYHLYKGDSSTTVARIVPDLLTPAQMREEERNGAWVPPCSLWIHDQSIMEALTDVADVIVATGLIALVDDYIKRHFSKKAPASSTPSRPELGSPKSMMDHVFKRRNSGGSTKSEREQRSSPLRYANGVAAY